MQEAEQQIKTFPETLNKNAEDGLSKALANAGVTIAFADYIKASKVLVKLLPEIIRLCEEDSESTFEAVCKQVESKFADLLFQVE